MPTSRKTDRKAPTKAAKKPRKKAPAKAKAKRKAAAGRSNAGGVRVVAIGASAGGLAPLEQLFDGMSNQTGLAFVVVQHLSPDFRSMMDELLARHSSMKIERVTKRVKLKPNTVYLNPPRNHLSIADGTLHLSEEKGDGISLPIDAFMASLAADAGDQAIGVILSGTGSDGTRGAAAIQAAGGKVIVQEPNSAKFESMPRSALDAQVANVTALPQEIGPLLHRLLSGDDFAPEPADDDLILDDPQREIIRLLQKRYGADFGYYKLSTVDRRIHRRAMMNDLSDISLYAKMLREQPEELESLYCDLLIGVTAFFRDPEAFKLLEEDVVPRICSKMSDERPIRVWVAGCASGEEAYSMAILLSEYARKNDVPLNAKVFASDIHFGSLEIAGRGEYPLENAHALPKELVERYFDRKDDKLRVRSELRSMVVFSSHNIIKDPPFTRIDLISCRNLLIYLNDIAQRKVLALFHFALHKEGTLFLGLSETTGELAQEFDTIDQKWRLFRKRRDVQLIESMRLLPVTSSLADAEVQEPAPANGAASAMVGSRRALMAAYDEVLRLYAPASLLTNREGHLLHVFGDAEKFIGVGQGAFSPRVVDIVKEPFNVIVGAALERARGTHGSDFHRDVMISVPDDTTEAEFVTVAIQRLPAGSVIAEHFLVSFTEKKRVQPVVQVELEYDGAEGEKKFFSQRIAELERDLRFTAESLQSTIEELETSNEELQATNEELMAANEEMQSTNEELHSVNEELYTVSAEHQRKIDELTELTADMDHLLRSTEVGTLFLDSELKIRRFTPPIARTFNLLDHDIGRPIDHVTSRFKHPGLKAELRKVLQGGEPHETSVDVEGSTFLMRMLPYVSESKKPEGAVVTLVDVTRLKNIERALEVRNEELARMYENLEQFTYIVSHDLRAPLRAVRNAAQWIEEDLGEAANEEIKGHVERLRAQTSRLGDMLKELLEYSRLGEDQSRIEEVDVQRLVEDVVAYLDHESEVKLVSNGELPTIELHRTPFQLVMQNLIDNAAKYSDKRQIEITVGVKQEKDCYRFSVADNGRGIMPEDQDKIFLPFRKLEHPDEKIGNGMGLALVKKAVAAHGGEISVASDPAKQRGTTFEFTWAKGEKKRSARAAIATTQSAAQN